MQIGVRELKAHLSEMLDRAASGEVILVTERGRLKAELGPLTPRSRLDQGVETGLVTPAEGGPPTPPTRRAAGRISIAEALDDDRGA